MGWDQYKIYSVSYLLCDLDLPLFILCHLLLIVFPWEVTLVKAVTENASLLKYLNLFSNMVSGSTIFPSSSTENILKNAPFQRVRQLVPSFLVEIPLVVIQMSGEGCRSLCWVFKAVAHSFAICCTGAWYNLRLKGKQKKAQKSEQH